MFLSENSKLKNKEQIKYSANEIMTTGKSLMSLFFANCGYVWVKFVVVNKKKPEIIKKNSTGRDEYESAFFISSYKGICS